MKLDLDLAEVSLGKDSRRVSSKNNFVKENLFQTAVLITVWRRLAVSFSPKVDYLLCRSLTENGLSKTIAQCSEFADQRVIRTNEDVSVADWLTHASLDWESHEKAEILQFLRFPKRFTFLDADLFERQSIQKFLNVNNRCKQLQRVELPVWLCDRLREVISDIMRGFRVDYADGRFSSGTCCDSAKSLRSKIRAFSHEQPYIWDVMYPLSNTCKTQHTFGEDSGWFRSAAGPFPTTHYLGEALAVPKNYKTHRIIVRESAYRGFQLQAVRAAIERCIENNGYDGDIDIHDQTTNQELGRWGVKMGNFATVDMTSASDSVRYDLAMTVFPPCVTREIRKWDSTGFMAAGRPHVKHMWSTSGAATTFVVESVLFYAVMRVATDLYCNFAGIDDARRELYYGAAYGDDVIVHADVFETFCDLLSMLGFIVNTDKSFCVESYRETCGGEWFWDGAIKDCATIYWPRKALCRPSAPVKGEINQQCLETLASLVSLQHRCFALWKDTTATDMGDIAIWYSEKIGCQPLRRAAYGTESLDVWDFIPNTPKKQLIPGLECSERTLLNVLTSGKKGFVDPCEPAVEMWLYQDFLRKGPKYSTPLDALLGVSESRKDAVASYYGQDKLRITRVLR